MPKTSYSSKFRVSLSSAELTVNRWTEYLSPPSPTQGTVRRIDTWWPFLENVQKPSPDVTSNSAAAVRLRDIIPRFISSMEFIGYGNCPDVMVQDQYDYDKRIILKALRIKMFEDRTFRGPDITEFEFDECIRYMEFINEQWAYVFFLVLFSRMVR